MTPHHFIITIHNAGENLRRVIDSVVKNVRAGGVVIPVLDGCTDQSAEIVESFQRAHGDVIRPITCPDLHEIGAINVGLSVAPPGHVFILQDDVVVETTHLVEFFDGQVLREYSSAGYVSMRMGGDIIVTTLPKLLFQMVWSRGRIRRRMVNVGNLVHSPFDTHVGRPSDRTIRPFEIRTIAAGVKSPVWMSSRLRDIVSKIDVKLMPYCCDDLDCSILSAKAGLTNLLVGIPYESRLEWGGTRKPKSNFSRDVRGIECRNRSYLFRKHKEWLQSGANCGRDHLLLRLK